MRTVSVLSVILVLLALFITPAYADIATMSLTPTVSNSVSCTVESKSFQLTGHVLQNVLFVSKAGNAMNLLEDKGKMCLVSQGNIKPIAKITIVLEDGTKLNGKLVTPSNGNSCVKDGPRLLTDEEMSQIHGEVATPQEIEAYKRAHPQLQK
jgi:hypothetical protein